MAESVTIREFLTRFRFKSDTAVLAETQDKLGKLKSGLLQLAGVAATMWALVKPASDVESAMNRVAATTGRVGDEATRLTEKLSKLSKEQEYLTTSTVDETAAVYKDLLIDGITPATEGFEKLAREILQFKTAARSSINDPLALRNIMQLLGIEADKFGEVSDKVFAAYQVGDFENIGELVSGLRMLAPAALQAKIPLDDMLTTLAMASQTGTTGAGIGQLRLLMMNILAPTGKAAELFKKLHIEIKDKGTGNIRAFGDVVLDLKKELDGLTDSERLVALKLIAPGRSVSALSSLLNMTVDDLDRFNARIKNSANATQKAFEQIMLSPEKQRAKFYIALKNIRADIGKGINEDTGRWMEKIGDMLEQWRIELEKSAPWVMKLTGKVVMLGAAFVTAALAIKGFTVAMATIFGSSILPIVLAASGLAIFLLFLDDMYQFFNGEKGTLLERRLKDLNVVMEEFKETGRLPVPRWMEDLIDKVVAPFAPPVITRIPEPANWQKNYQPLQSGLDKYSLSQRAQFNVVQNFYTDPSQTKIQEAKKGIEGLWEDWDSYVREQWMRISK